MLRKEKTKIEKKQSFLKTIITLKFVFYDEKEMQDIKMEIYLDQMKYNQKYADQLFPAYATERSCPLSMIRYSE